MSTITKESNFRLSFFLNSPPFGDRLGGIATYILHRAHILSENNFTIYWTDGFNVALFDKELREWKIIREFKTNKIKKKIISRFPKLLPGIKFLLNDIEIDLIEFPDSYGYSIKPLKDKCKVIIQCHTSSPVREFLNDLKPGFRSRRNAKRIRKNLLIADKILACSYEIALLTSGYYRIHLDRFNVINHAFAKELFIAENLESSKSENYFIVVANVEYIKAIDLLIKAFIEYKKNGGKNKLYYIGPKDLFDVPSPMKERWAELNVDKLLKEIDANDFKFIPYLNKDEVLKLISKATTTMILSRFEAFTMVVGEAASVGCPLIISNRIGWNNLINRFDAGIMVNPYDKNEVANAMLEMENLDTQRRYSERIKSLNDFLSSDSMITATINEYIRIK